MAAILCAAIAISYLDRQALSVAIAAIQRDIPLSNTEFSQLQAAFLLAYAVMYAAAASSWTGSVRAAGCVGQQSWSTLVMIVPTDLFERRVVASVAGLVGFGGAMGGVIFSLAAGRILDSGLGYGVVFSIVGTFHVLAFIVILLTIRRIEPVGLARAAA